MTIKNFAALGGTSHFPLEPTGKAPMLFVPMDRVISCKTLRDAIHTCILHDPIRGRTAGYYADHLEIDRAHWSRMMNGTASIGLDLIALQLLCRNWAVNQWLNYCAGLDTVKRELTLAEKAAMYDAMQAQA